MGLCGWGGRGGLLCVEEQLSGSGCDVDFGPLAPSSCVGTRLKRLIAGLLDNLHPSRPAHPAVRTLLILFGRKCVGLALVVYALTSLTLPPLILLLVQSEPGWVGGWAGRVVCSQRQVPHPVHPAARRCGSHCRIRPNPPPTHRPASHPPHINNPPCAALQHEPCSIF